MLVLAFSLYFSHCFFPFPFCFLINIFLFLSVSFLFSFLSLFSLLFDFFVGIAVDGINGFSLLYYNTIKIIPNL